MEKLNSLKTSLLALSIMAISTSVQAQQGNNDERLGLPGDNLNLAAVLDIFQRSQTLESFEAALNSDTSKVNNLDLNNDERVDYIKVFDKPEGDLHTIVLQVDLSDQESQDVAVIFVEKKGEDVSIQMVGDEDLYGKDYILEPSSQNQTSTARSATPNPGYRNGGTTVVNNYYYNNDNNYYNDRPDYAPAPHSWVIVRYIYTPFYRPYYSHWRWGYYPGWYRPWSPWYYDNYYNHWYYQHSWNGWWYWRAPHNHFHNYWYGPYRSSRRASAIYMRNRSAGVYDRSYNNPRPAPRPTGKPRYANHAVPFDRNPTIVKPTVSPGRPVAPGRKPEPTRPVYPSKNQDTRPTTPVKQDTRPTTPVKQEPTRPTYPSKDQDTRPTTPVKQEPTRPTYPSKDQETRPTTPVKQEPIRPAPSKQQEVRPENSTPKTQPGKPAPTKPAEVKPSRTPRQSPSKPAGTTRSSSGSRSSGSQENRR